MAKQGLLSVNRVPSNDSQRWLKLKDVLAALLVQKDPPRREPLVCTRAQKWERTLMEANSNLLGWCKRNCGFGPTVNFKSL